MKRSNWVRLIAVILIISMMAAPVSAATVRPGADYSTNSFVGSLFDRIRDIIRDIIDDWFDRPDKPVTPRPTEPVAPPVPSEPGVTEPVVTDPTEPVGTDPTKPVDPSEPEDPTETPKTDLELVEGHSNTKNGHLLRGVTYTLSQVISEQNQAPVSHVGLRKPIQVKPRNPISSLSLNAVSTTATDDTDITNGLLAHYDFETVTDNTVSNNVTTNTTTTAVLNGSVTVEETDHMGNAIQFNGGGLQLTNIVNATTSSFSVSMWYKAGNDAHYNLIQAGTIDGSTGRTILLLNSDSKYFTYLTGDNARVTTGAIDRSVWQHITFSYDKDTNKAYFFVNGVADNADGVTLSGSPLDTADMIFGRHRTASDPFNGLIDEVRVYNKVLTAAEAAAVYAYAPTATPDPDPTDPEQPEQSELTLTVTARYSTNRLSWNAQDGVTYTVERSSDNATWTTLGTATTGGYLDETAGKGTQYYYRVTADGVSSEAVRGLETGMNALKAIAVLFYAGNDDTTFDGTNMVELATGDKATELNAMVSGTIIYKATPSSTSGIQAVLGTDNGKFVGMKDGKFRHQLGNLSGEHATATVTAGADNTAGFTYNDSDGYWFMSSNGSTMTSIDLDEANFGILTDVGAGTYYAGGSSANSFNGTINYIIVLEEVLTNAELSALTSANADHDAENAQPETNTNLVYIPVTMFNYDMNTMNEKTISMYEEGFTLYSGIHFSDGKPGGSVTYAVTAHTGEYTNGQYVIQNYLMKDNNQPSWLTCTLEGEKGITSTANQADAAIWTLTRRPGANVFTLTTEIDGTTYYMTMGNETSGVTTEYSEITLVYYTHTNAGIQITKDGYYLAHSEGNLFCGSTNSTSTSNGMGFFPVAEDGTIGTTARTVTTINGAVTSGFSRWNWWSYLEDNDAAQNKFFAELVQHELDENGDIVFNVIEPGIFKTGTGENIADKDVYTNVGLPFVLDETTGFYSFNSDLNGVYFADKDGDGVSDPASGTETNLELLKFDLGAPQGWSGMHYGDGSSKLWAPFNTNVNDDAEDHIDYHFGMRADIPFSMTPNGRIKSTDDTSDPISFTFSGDDDVWVFIDGHLVIDLGGIHNRIGATIDFANNTITYFLPESNTSTAELGCYNDRTRYPLNADGETITVKLYNDAEGEGSLGQTRLDFSSEEAHTMSIFYMERGKGTSNCHIEFNLPMRDTVLVTKDITKSWSEEQDANDGENDGTAPLTAKEQAAVDKLDFYFKLYKKEADGETSVVANTNFYLQDKTGKVLAIPSTGPDGLFSLKNGQTAKFMTEMSREGVTYYVEEVGLDLNTFLTPDYNYRGVATNGFHYEGYALDTDSEVDNATEYISEDIDNAGNIPEHELPMDATVLKSYDITAYGSIESIDSLEFICTNYLNADLPLPTARAYEDIIVIDYGLPVKIDPLHNDLFRGDDIEIVAWGDESLTLDEVLSEENNIYAVPDGTEGGTSWSGTQVFHSGNVTFNDVDYAETTNSDGTITYTRDTFEYRLTEQMTEVEVIHYIIKVNSTVNETVGDEVIPKTGCRYALGQIYIVPATIMYYEENFSDFVTFSNNSNGNAWGQTEVTNGASDFQEPGVVGTATDSTYGSDVAYLHDSFDSNGTSRYANTTNGALRFTYTFTGTGTSIFARTSATTGYIQVKLYEGAEASGNYKTYYRDTYYHDENGIGQDNGKCLYNIPVYTIEDLTYGTYTIVCTIAKAGTPTEGNPNGSGNQFFLDGIRVMQPLNENSDRSDLVLKAQNAYSTDGESNLDTVTLRKKLIKDAANGVEWDGENFVVMTDYVGNIITAADYISIGPKEEVYLAPGQKITFSLKNWETDGLKLYLGMKAPFGTGTVNVGNTAVNLENAPDCYYDITSYGSTVPVTENGVTYNLITYSIEVPSDANCIVSLTNLKVVGNYEFTIVEKD